MKDMKTATLASQLSVDSLPTSGHYVYFFDSEHGCKVGVSLNVKARFTQLQNQLPFEIWPLALFRCTGSLRADELQFHQLLKDSRIRGEWYDSTACRELVEEWRLDGVDVPLAGKRLHPRSQPTTDRQMQVLDRIEGCFAGYKQLGRLVTFRMLMAAIGAQSTNSVSQFLRVLIEQGHLIRVPEPPGFMMTEPGARALEQWRIRRRNEED